MFPQRTDAAIDLSVACSPHRRRLSRGSQAAQAKRWKLKIGLLPNVAELLTSREAQVTRTKPSGKRDGPVESPSRTAFQAPPRKKLEAWHILANGPDFATVARPCGSLSNWFHSRELPL
jgi:hypothetical protein